MNQSAEQCNLRLQSAHDLSDIQTRRIFGSKPSLLSGGFGETYGDRKVSNVSGYTLVKNLDFF
jgi:hypothetical protein